MKIILYLPEGQELVIDKSVKELTTAYDEDTSQPLMFDNKLIMHNGKLEQVRH